MNIKLTIPTVLALALTTQLAYSSQVTPTGSSSAPSQANLILQPARDSHTAIVQALLAAKQDIEVGERGTLYTPLHKLVCTGEIAAIQKLIWAGENVAAQRISGPIIDAQTSNGDTALHMLARVGRTEIIEILLSAGANKEILNKAGETSLVVAKRTGQKQAELMLEGYERLFMERLDESLGIISVIPLRGIVIEYTVSAASVAVIRALLQARASSYDARPH